MHKKFARTTSFFLSIFLFTLLSQTLLAQDIPVTFRIHNIKKEPVAYASVTAVSRIDSSDQQKKLADSLGKVVFTLHKGTQYLITITSVNYLPVEKGIAISDQSTFDFVMETASKTLGGVVVTSKKPLMRQEDDKTIVDPENLVASSTNGYEVLEKTPGLFIDQDGNIYISSMTPASIYINGREMKMSASDVATMLKSLPPNSIAKIEILRTPSAKYDASGTGGIVNVVLKKGVKLGVTGSVNTGWQQGTYSTEFVGFNLNNNSGKKSSYLNLNYNKRNNYEKIKTDRLFAPDSLLSQNAYTKYPSDVYYLGYGISYELGKKWEISYDGRASLNDFNNKSNNQNLIKKISTDQTLSNNINNVSNDGSSFLINNGLSTKYKIDSLGSEWTNDVSYTYARNKADQVFNTFFFSPPIAGFGGDGKSDNRRHFLTAQSDLKLKLAKKFTFETGFKTSVLSFNSVTNYFTEVGGTRSKDNARTNTFHYNENINALYLQGSKTIGAVVIKAGTRMENTNMKGRQIIPGDTSFSIHRTDFFPYVYISRNIMRIMGYDLRAYLVYRRTISRPVYEQLNPFPRYVDEYLSEAGNPTLRPQFTTNYEANISVDDRPIIAVGVNDTKDIFTNVIYQSDGNQRQAIRTYDNLGKNKEWYFRALGALPNLKKYFIVLGTQYNHNFYQGIYEDKPLLFKKGTWTFFTYQTFKIDKRSMITLNGFIRFKGQQQFYELGTFGSLNTSLNRQFFKQKLTVTASLNDIFASNKNTFTITQGSVSATGFRQNDTRKFGINLRYNFGIKKKDEAGNMFNVESPN